MKTILATIKAGEPLASTPFIDSHGHFGPWPSTHIPYTTDHGRVVGEMDRYGCDMLWMSASEPGFRGDMAVKNDYVFNFAAAHPERIVPYCTLSANDQDRNVEELRRCLDRGPCVGVKMHRYEQPHYSLLDTFMQPILEILSERRLLYMNHDLGNLEELVVVTERYPELTFMCGHFTPGLSDLALKLPNVFHCTCAAIRPDCVADEIKRIGSKSMLVGSDFSLFALAFGIGMVAYADVPETDKQNLLGLNALRILEHTSWFDRSMLKCTHLSGVKP